MDEINYDVWLKNYNTKKKIKIKEKLDDKDIEVLQKLDIIVEDKDYTQCEYDHILYSLLEYWTDDEEQKKFKKEEFCYLRFLKEKGVDKKEYDRLLNKIIKIEYR